MNTIQAGFDILVLLAAVDGRIDRSEMEVIKVYVDDNFSGEFDIQNEIALLRSLDGQDKLRYFGEAADLIKEDTSTPSREALVDFALELIMKDGILHPREKFMVSLLGEHWGIDVHNKVDDFVQTNSN